MYGFPNLQKILTTIYSKLNYSSRDHALFLSGGGHIGIISYRPPESLSTLFTVVHENLTPYTMQIAKSCDKARKSFQISVFHSHANNTVITKIYFFICLFIKPLLTIWQECNSHRYGCCFQCLSKMERDRSSLVRVSISENTRFYVLSVHFIY